MSRQDIVDSYVFVTAGACGPCRFGMYEAEYRLALRNSGFDGFRVHPVPAGGRPRTSPEPRPGLEMNLDFFLGDPQRHEHGRPAQRHRLPDAAVRGQAGRDRPAMREGMERLYEVATRQARLHDRRRRLPGMLAEAGAATAPDGRQVRRPARRRAPTPTRSPRCGDGARREVEVDRTRVKPIVKITGEFWAQTTEGDGNFKMFAFLEREGAQVLVEPVGTWIMYMIHQAKQQNLRPPRPRATTSRCRPRGALDRKMANELRTRRKNAVLLARRGHVPARVRTACARRSATSRTS